MYYYEEYRINQWSARTQSDLPRDRGGEGEKKNIRGVVEINPSHEHLTLDQLREIYSPDGTLQATGKTSSAPEPVKPETYQARVWSWVVTCFGNDVAFNKEERCDRFLEEVFELLQSLGYDPARVDALKSYVWSRDVGEPEQETGGVMVTLCALLSAHMIDMRNCAEKELERVWGKIEKIRAKQAAKPVGSALPQEWSPRPEEGDFRSDFQPTMPQDMPDRICINSKGYLSVPDDLLSQWADKTARPGSLYHHDDKYQSALSEINRLKLILRLLIESKS